MCYSIQIKILNFSRWYNFSNETNESDKRDDALEGIRYYFAHVINDVYTFRLPYLIIYFYFYRLPFCTNLFSRALSHQVKAKMTVKIFFDVCEIFSLVPFTGSFIFFTFTIIFVQCEWTLRHNFAMFKYQRKYIHICTCRFSSAGHSRP